MYCTFTKSQSFPLTIVGISSQVPKFLTPVCITNQQSFSPILRKKPIFSPVVMNFSTSSHGFIRKAHKSFQILGPRVALGSFKSKISGGEEGYSANSCYFLSGGYRFEKVRGVSTAYSGRVEGRRDSVDNGGKSFPWLDGVKGSEGKKTGVRSVRSSWEESAEKFLKRGQSSMKQENDVTNGRRNSEVEVVETRRFDRRVDGNDRRKSSEVQSVGTRRFDRRNDDNGRSKSSEVEGNRRFDRRIDDNDRKRSSEVENVGNRRFDRRIDDNDWRRSSEDELDVESAEFEENPKWYKIKDRFDRTVNVKHRPNGPDVRRWDRQESWGKKTWKEANESTIPKMVGEGIYGVGPVLAALTAARREVYALYVQEGLDLSSNNRKKKDKKGFEKILRMAEKLGVSKKETSKHDLNMIVDNRPHQGLVLDASPLEMVNIRELDRVLPDEEVSPVWVALDEVTDPQNLGAIIRSAYFFGVLGVVLCAKNSAPLSGVVSKASAGSLELTELRSCKNMMQFLLSSAENGWRVIGGSVSSRAVPLNEIAAAEPTILVLGSEGTGLRPLVERSCTHLVRIPGNFPVNVTAGLEDEGTQEMDQRSSGEEFQSFLAVESLNVSVAAGVLLHHLVGINNRNTENSQVEQVCATV